VNRALVTALWRQRLTSPMRMLLLFAVFFPPLGLAALTGSIAPLHGLASFFAMVLAAGAIGQDVSAGVLQLTFARPVSRPVYVTSRWFAAGAGGFAIGLAQLALGALVVAARGAGLDALDLLVMMLTSLIGAFTGAAVLVALSSLVSGLADVALFAMAFIGLPIAKQIALFRNWPIAATAIGELSRTLQPSPNLGWIAGHGVAQWTDLVTAFSTIALALTVAILGVNRKELSYAAD
jgi:ABC-type transport system involved in multi-copper enzyme maturation permease subunit